MIKSETRELFFAEMPRTKFRSKLERYLSFTETLSKHSEILKMPAQ